MAMVGDDGQPFESRLGAVIEWKNFRLASFQNCNGRVSAP
jgi:hypothetical protein